MLNNSYCVKRFTYSAILLSVILLSLFHSIESKAETIICDATDDQGGPQIISDGSGGSIIVWHDDRSGTWAIYAQRMNADEEVLWTENGVLISGGSGNQSGPRLISDGSGGAFVVWQGQGSDGYGDVYAQHINSSGSIQWGTDGVHVCDQLKDQRDIDLESDGSGGIIISWTDYRNSSHLNIYAQRLNSEGVPQWTDDGVVVCGASGGQQDPVIASDGSGGAIIAWEDYRITPADSKGIYVQRLNSSGIPQWTADGIPLNTSSYGGAYAQIISDDSGGAIITWSEYRGVSADIYVQSLNSSGSAQWTTGGVLVCSASNTQDNPYLVGDGSGGAFLTWNDCRDTYVSIYAQSISSSGVPQWTTDGVAVATGYGNKYSPRIIRYGASDTILTWEDTRDNNYDIYAQKLDGSGVAQWTENGVRVYGPPGDQEDPELIGDGSGGAFIVWDDSDIYMQHVYSNGTLYLPTVIFTAETQQINEDVVSTEITVQLSAVSDVDVTIPFTIGGTATEGLYEDFTITASPVVISSGSVSKTITIYVTDDSDYEPDETVIVTLGTPTNANLGRTTVHTVTIQDNEPTADIAVNKMVSSRKVSLNEQVIFTIEASNNGPEDATGITVSDILPAGLTYVSHQADSGTYELESGQWTLDTLTNGETATLTITVTAAQKGRITNTAAKTSSTPIDPATGNDSDRAVVFVDMTSLPWLMLLLDD